MIPDPELSMTRLLAVCTIALATACGPTATRNAPAGADGAAAAHAFADATKGAVGVLRAAEPGSAPGGPAAGQH